MTTALGRIGREAAWAPIAVVVVHWLVGGWLGHEPVVDPIMHFAGGMAAAFFFWHAATCARRYMGAPSSIALGLLALGLATLSAVGWEFGEFLSDTFRGTTMQRGVANTMRDLFLGVCGAGVYVASYGLLTRRRSHRGGNV